MDPNVAEDFIAFLGNQTYEHGCLILERRGMKGCRCGSCSEYVLIADDTKEELCRGEFIDDLAVAGAAIQVEEDEKEKLSQK